MIVSGVFNSKLSVRSSVNLLSFNSKLQLISNKGAIFNSILNARSEQGKVFNSRINVGAERDFNLKFNSVLNITAPTGTLKEWNYNSNTDIRCGLDLILPITFSIFEQLFISAQANMLSFSVTDELPFSKIGGV